MPASFTDEAEPALRLSGVHAGYQAKAPVLRGIDLAIGPGEVYALIGPNGAGKSTAARVACGLLRPDQGSVRRAKGKARGFGAGGVSLAPQDNALFPALTIRENLRVMARTGGCDRRSVEADVEHALKLTACEARADQVVSTLSGGWRRRANLAGALVVRSSLIVADEPTEGVDAATRVALAKAIRDAAGEGAAWLIISHDARFVEMAADRIGLIVAGRIIAEGPPQRLLQETFDDQRTVAARFPAEPMGPLAARLSAAGLTPSEDHLTWREIAASPFERALALASLVDEGDGEITVSRPDLDDLATMLIERHA